VTCILRIILRFWFYDNINITLVASSAFVFYILASPTIVFHVVHLKGGSSLGGD
jgi:hypothetical protein